MVSTTWPFLWSRLKQVKFANSLASRSPPMKTDGEMCTMFRLIDVLKTAIDGDSLNMTAMNLPVGSQQTLLGIPPTLLWPRDTCEKSAIGKDCFGAVDAEREKSFIFPQRRSR